MQVHYQRIRFKTDIEIGRFFKKINSFWEYLKLIKNNPTKIGILDIDFEKNMIKIKTVSTR